jgi:hypothetical protein
VSLRPAWAIQQVPGQPGLHSEVPSQINKNKNNKAAGHQWLMPVILATWEAEIRRITA